MICSTSLTLQRNHKRWVEMNQAMACSVQGKVKGTASVMVDTIRQRQEPKSMAHHLTDHFTALVIMIKWLCQ
eukprot:3615565-Prorocentrum_lima.AAC.1